MELATDTQAIPWVFDDEETIQLRAVFSNPLIKAYMQSLKHLALENGLVDPTSSTTNDVLTSNAYMAGQGYIIDTLMADNLYVPTKPKEITNV